MRKSKEPVTRKKSLEMVDNPRELTFSVELLWDKRSGGQVNLGGHEPLKIDARPEFGGEGMQPCPDELFFAAIGGCIMTTFLYVVRKLRLPLLDLKITVDGEVTLYGPEGYRLTSVKSTIQAKTLKEYEFKAQECAKLTRDFCHLTKLIEKVVPFELSTKVECV